ncbi:uncharacterized protein LOC135142116 [Zophobas morio]|uniref:uncharacterized protein LOC135142116 n=1 Tax=Zophobas morio TaxID=2755281 RepID=UPI00308364F1
MFTQKITVHPKLFNAFSPIMKLSRIMCLFPVRYYKLKTMYVIKWSWEIYYSHLFVIILFASWATWGAIRDLQVDYFHAFGFKDTLDFIINCFDVVEAIITSFIFVLTTPFRYKHVYGIIDNFKTVDRLIPPILNEEICKMSKFAIFILLTYLLTLYILDLFMWNLNSWQGLNNYFAFYVLYTVVVVHQLQYWIFLILAKAKMLASWASWGFLHDMQVASFTSLGFRGTADFAIAAFDVSEVITSASIFVISTPFKYQYIEISPHSISSVITSYSCMSELIDNINKCFNGTITMIILSCYIHLVICPYELFVILTNNEVHIFNYVYFLWISLHVSRLLVVVEVLNLRNLVARVMCCKLNQAVRKELVEKKYYRHMLYLLLTGT